MEETIATIGKVTVIALINAIYYSLMFGFIFTFVKMGMFVYGKFTNNEEQMKQKWEEKVNSARQKFKEKFTKVNQEEQEAEQAA